MIDRGDIMDGEPLTKVGPRVKSANVGRATTAGAATASAAA